MQQRTGSIAGFYQSQVESVQDVTAASIEGFERMQQLTLQAFRQQLDNQFRLANTLATRSAEVLVDPELARPALDRMIDVQRQLADAVVRTNQRVLAAVNASAQKTVEQGSSLSGATEANETGGDYAALMQSGLEQWQELTNRMLDVFHQQFAAATGEFQRQGQRAFDQTSEAIQTRTRALQATAQQGEQGAQASQQNPQQRSSKERKHEIA